MSSLTVRMSPLRILVRMRCSACRELGAMFNSQFGATCRRKHPASPTASQHKHKYSRVFQPSALVILQDCPEGQTLICKPNAGQILRKAWGRVSIAVFLLPDPEIASSRGARDEWAVFTQCPQLVCDPRRGNSVSSRLETLLRAKKEKTTRLTPAACARFCSFFTIFMIFSWNI